MLICQKAKKSGGFTLIEAIFALFFLAVIAALFPMWIQVMDHREVAAFDDPQEEAGKLDPMAVELFFQEAGMEIREAVGLKVEKDPDRIILEKYSGKYVEFEYYRKKQIRRQVNDGGHEVMLYNVGKFQLEPFAEGLKITVTGLKGREYERIFLPLVPSAK